MKPLAAIVSGCCSSGGCLRWWCSAIIYLASSARQRRHGQPAIPSFDQEAIWHGVVFGAVLGGVFVIFAASIQVGGHAVPHTGHRPGRTRWRACVTGAMVVAERSSAGHGLPQVWTGPTALDKLRNPSTRYSSTLAGRPGCTVLPPFSWLRCRYGGAVLVTHMRWARRSWCLRRSISASCIPAGAIASWILGRRRLDAALLLPVGRARTIST